MRICEHFRSLQGEGIMIGVPTFFIRTVGCNLSCKWCDTQYAMTGGEDMAVSELVRLVGDDDVVCITGGEPMLQPDTPELISELTDLKKRVVLETNGAVSIASVPSSERVIISMDIKCPSSGMDKKMVIANLDYLFKKDQLKFVISDKTDLDYAVKFLKDNPTKANVIFTPVGGMDLGPLADAVLKMKLNVRVLPQLHKVIWGEKRGV